MIKLSISTRQKRPPMALEF